MNKRKNYYNAPAVVEPKGAPTIKVGKTPIEIALGIDEQGRTTARKLYSFLELNQSQYARWCRNNITENDFAEENVDYWAFVINDERNFNTNIENSSSRTSKRNSTSMSNLHDMPKVGRGNTHDYILTATFAKKLAMSSNSARGEQAREYFVRVEELLKKAVATGRIEQKTPIATLNEVELLDLQQAKARYSLGRSSLVEIGEICGGLVWIGRSLRYHRRTFDSYFERVAGVGKLF